MNIEQQQQQELTVPPPPPPPAAALTTALLSNEAYACYNQSSNATPVTSSAITPQATTYANIGLLAPVLASASVTSSDIVTISAASTVGTIAGLPPLVVTTSTFKTPLLPMPTLDDIEATNMMPIPHSNSNQPIPGGILKYPTTVTTPHNTLQMNLPIGIGLGPPPPPPPSLSLPPSVMQQQMQMHEMSQQQHQHMQSPTTLLLNNDATTCGTLKSNAKLLNPSTSLSPTTTMTPSGGIQNLTMLRGGNVVSSSTSNLRHKSTTASSSASSASSATSSSKCCACFGSGRSNVNSTTKSKKKRKQKVQTLWSALLTNLGICALLLAYTLLGSFIFLTIESEDSSLLHQQRTLASTKRVMGVSSNGRTTNRGSSSSSSSSNSNSHINNNNDSNDRNGASSSNIYHSQQQSEHLDNGTMSSASSASASSSLYASTSLSSQTMLEGMFSSNINNNNNNNNNNDFIYGDDAQPQLALSQDTYDVRQRTIENIWDITVSLNILYKENWTKLAALEIAKFQDQLIKRLNEDTLLQLSHEIDGASVNGNGNNPSTEAVLLHTHQYGHHGPHEWNFAKAFLYSLTVLTTIGYGNIAPRTTLGRLITLVYALFGIPLTLVYLSSTGGILAKVAREVFSKALCCCLCSNCGYCCYDEKRMAEKERRTRRKRQQEELRKQRVAMQEPYYVRSGSMHDSFQTPEKQPPPPSSSSAQMPDVDSLSASESRGSMHGLSILAPILLCLSMMIIYIMFGALVLYRLENWPLLDGIYFCFMSLSTIGFGDMLPGMRRESTTTTWFCSIYIMSGMALTAMCFNVIHEEIVHRIKIVVEFKKGSALDATNDTETGYYMPP